MKTACTALDDHTLIKPGMGPETEPLSEFAMISIPHSEPWAANVLRWALPLFSHQAASKNGRGDKRVAGYQLETIDAFRICEG